MIHKISKMLKPLLLCLVIATVLPARAKDVYGFMTGNSSYGEVPIGMYKFDTDSLKPQLLTSLTYQFWGGAYVGDKYLMILSDDATGYLTEGLCSYDINSGSLKLRYAQQPCECSDLTYDYSTSTLFGIMVKNTGEEVTPRLIKIDTKTGKYTKVAMLDKKIVAIACNYYGDLYAMSDEGKLYDMDKTTGELSLRGDTGMKGSTSEAQSMEFDRNTGELYWSGLDENDYAFFCQLNPNNGSVIKRDTLADNSLIAGLHIPFTVAADDAPAKPQDLSSNADNNGVTLTWTNPSTTYGGQTLNNITKVEVWKDEMLIKTLEQVQPGEKMTFTDNSKGTNGKARYIVYAYNEMGRGEGASVKVIVGEDTPGTVTDLTAVKDGGNVNLSWTAPTTGKNGGSIKQDGLTYNITRQPDGKQIKGLKDTHYTDDLSSEQACYYTWQVTCVNNAGEGDAAQTQPLTAGQPITLPYAIDFDGTIWRNQWQIIDNNGDGNTWTNQGDAFIYNTSYTNAADDSILSVPFDLKSNTRYVVRYDIMAPELFSSENFRLSLKHKGKETILEDLKDFTTPGFSDSESRNVTFTVDSDGEYQFCMTALSAAGQFMIKISAFSVEIEKETDLSAVALSTEAQLYKDKESAFEINVKNIGSKRVDSYTVTLTDGKDNTLASKTVTTPMESNTTASVCINYTPAASGPILFKAIVKANGDDNTANDTVSQQFNVLDSVETVVEMGGTDYYTDIPFWFSGKTYSYTQAIYLKEEIGGKVGEIRQLQYDYANSGEDVTAKTIKVFMSNTNNADMTSGWINESAMTLVLDTVVDFRNGENTLMLQLHTPFVYTGKNLCIMTEKIDNEQTNDVYFYAAATDEPRTAVYNGNEAEVSLADVQLSTRLNQVRIIKTDDSTLGIQQMAQPNTLRLISNGNSISIEGKQDAQFTVTDLCGKTITRLQHAQSININNMPSGMYIVKAEANGQQAILKVTVK